MPEPASRRRAIEGGAISALLYFAQMPALWPATVTIAYTELLEI